jgi:tRNA threonylcarbamoyladenosine biosynthesis protein TsaB
MVVGIMSDRTATNSKLPRILVLETSSRMGSVGVALGPDLLREEHFSQSMRRAIELMPAARRLCQAAGWQPEMIEQIYLSTGPGSFTGLRIAISVARAMAQAIGCKLVGVSTVDVLARNAPDHAQNLIVALDAKRGQIFGARYARQAHDMVRTAGPALVDPTEFVRQTPTPVAVLGEGIDYHRAALEAGIRAKDQYAELDRALWTPTVRAVHALGWTRAARGDFDDPASILPVYIRLAEAEEVWNRKHAVAK